MTARSEQDLVELYEAHLKDRQCSFYGERPWAGWWRGTDGPVLCCSPCASTNLAKLFADSVRLKHVDAARQAFAREMWRALYLRLERG